MVGVLSVLKSGSVVPVRSAPQGITGATSADDWSRTLFVICPDSRQAITADRAANARGVRALRSGTRTDARPRRGGPSRASVAAKERVNPARSASGSVRGTFGNANGP